ncbi:hypothetical protein PINS_up004532 [Pythium insidiosum]|nr:hypothetical protein PINS_up004532 [Pythium insidiosum]
MSALKGANTQWTTCGRKLLVDGRSFFVRGVNYAPTPIGKPGRLDMLGHEEIFTRDLVNLRAMHANAVKTYDFYSYVDHGKFLDAAYNGGKRPIYTVFSIWVDQSLMEPMTPINGPEFQQMVRNYYEMAKQTSGHPGVMGYSIGGEINSIVVIREPSFWKKFALLTQAVRKGINENNAQKIITTTFVDDGGMSFTTGEEFHADVDLWGSNVYQTNYAGSVIPTYMRVPSTKPLLVSEYGFPYASNTAEGGPEDLDMIARMLVEQTVAMERNYNLSDPLREQILVGGFVFEYSDEWWKAGNENVHNLGEVANGGFPLGYLSEEFFGLYRAVRPEHPEAIDKMHPRPTVDLLRDIWSKGTSRWRRRGLQRLHRQAQHASAQWSVAAERPWWRRECAELRRGDHARCRRDGRIGASGLCRLYDKVTPRRVPKAVANVQARGGCCGLHAAAGRAIVVRFFASPQRRRDRGGGR